MTEEKMVVDRYMARVVEKIKQFGCLRCSSNGCFFFDDGSTTSAGVVGRLIEAGLLQGQEDGLFPGMSQSYALSGKECEGLAK